MVTGRTALVMIAIGVVAFVAGIYGVGGPEVAIPLSSAGLLTLLGGAGLLVWSARPWHLSMPHRCVVAIAVIAAGLHAYEHIYESSGDPSIGFLLWSMLPYGLCIVLSAFPATNAAAIAGAAVALVFDFGGHYSVFVNPRGSTAALAQLFIPLWSTIIVVPLATLIAWSVLQRRSRPQGDVP